MDFLIRAAQEAEREHKVAEAALLDLKPFRVQEVEIPAVGELHYRETSFKGELKELFPYEKMKHIVDIKSDVNAISALNDTFEKILIEDFIQFKERYPQYKQAILLSETSREPDNQVAIMLKYWESGGLVKTYGGFSKTKEILLEFLESCKNNTFFENAKTLTYKELKTHHLRAQETVNWVYPLLQKSTTAREFTTATLKNIASSAHIAGRAVDISGRNNSPSLKEDLFLFLHEKKNYTIFLYTKNGENPFLSSQQGVLYFYKTKNPPYPSFLKHFFRDYADTFFFHVEKR